MLSNIEQLFSGYEKNLKICINHNKSYNILNHIQTFNITNKCSDICFSESKKIIKEEKICVLNCSDSDNYKYEYNNFCYQSCPNGTYSENFLCIDNIKNTYISSTIINYKENIYNNTTNNTINNDFLLKWNIENFFI